MGHGYEPVPDNLERILEQDVVACVFPHPTLLFAGNEDGLARGWDIRDAQVKFELTGHASRVWAVACSMDGKAVASVSDDLTVRLWNLQAQTCQYVMRGHSDWIRAVAFSPDSRLVASAGEDGKVFIWDVMSDNNSRRSTVA